MEADPIITDAQPKLRRFDVLKTLEVALAGFQIAGQRMQNPQSSKLIDSAEISPSLIHPDNAFTHI
jgi:hypothetical protein